MIIKKTIQKYGCCFDTATNGLEALNRAKEAIYDIIFMDCQMPEMDGFEATEKIREFETEHNRKKSHVVALTADAMIGDRDKCLSVGMNDYINKPFKEKDIGQVFEKWCAKNQKV
jgi:CheY-like chemotaxis protein